jgi:predicted N-acetyltransferase YhbS
MEGIREHTFEEVAEYPEGSPFALPQKDDLATKETLEAWKAEKDMRIATYTEMLLEDATYREQVLASLPYMGLTEFRTVLYALRDHPEYLENLPATQKEQLSALRAALLEYPETYGTAKANGGNWWTDSHVVFHDTGQSLMGMDGPYSTAYPENHGGVVVALSHLEFRRRSTGVVIQKDEPIDDVVNDLDMLSTYLSPEEMAQQVLGRPSEAWIPAYYQMEYGIGQGHPFSLPPGSRLALFDTLDWITPEELRLLIPGYRDICVMMGYVPELRRGMRRILARREEFEDKRTELMRVATLLRGWAHVITGGVGDYAKQEAISPEVSQKITRGVSRLAAQQFEKLITRDGEINPAAEREMNASAALLATAVKNHPNKHEVAQVFERLRGVELTTVSGPELSEEVVRQLRELHTLNRAVDTPASRAIATDGLEQALTNPRCEFTTLHAVNPGKNHQYEPVLVGFYRSEETQPSHKELGSLNVNPHLDRSGIGRALLMTQLQRDGEQCTLHAACVPRLPALAMYSQLGFVITDCQLYESPEGQEWGFGLQRNPRGEVVTSEEKQKCKVLIPKENTQVFMEQTAPTLRGLLSDHIITEWRILEDTGLALHVEATYQPKATLEQATSGS